MRVTVSIACLLMLTNIPLNTSGAAEVISKVDSVVFHCVDEPKSSNPEIGGGDRVVKNSTTVGRLVREELEKRCLGQTACELNLDSFLSENKIDFEYCKNSQNRFSVAYRCNGYIKFVQLSPTEAFKAMC